MFDSATPLISVVVPCYNQGRFLAGALDSLIAQDYNNWECFIINDGSMDHTEKVANIYVKDDKRFSYIKTLNMGLSSARNKGIEIASGQYIQLLDADDLLEEKKLSNAIQYYHSNIDVKKIITYSSMRYFEDGDVENTKIIGRDGFIAHVELKLVDNNESQKEVLRLKNPFVVSAPLYPKVLFDDIGYFDVELTALEDWDFHIRCINSGYKFHHLYLPKSNTLIRLHNSSMMNNSDLLNSNFNKLVDKHDLRAKQLPQTKNLIKAIVKELIPPIFFRLKSCFKTS